MTNRLVALTVFLVSLAVYVRTLLPGVAFADWGEMQVVPYVLGIAHPTGYPTYILLGWLIDQIPLGSVAFRANLLSAVCTSATLAISVLVMHRFGVRPAIAAAAALALGATATVWAAATVAEVNPLHLLFAALLVHRALIWEERLALRDLVIGGVLVGLALGNHLLTVTIAPVVIAFVIWTGRHEIRRRVWILGPATLATIAGLAVYLYIPIRASQHPALAYNRPETLEGVLWLVRGTQFQHRFGFLSPEGPGRLVDGLGPLWTTLSASATPPFLVVGLLGLVVLVRWQPAIGLASVSMLLGGLYVYATYEHLEHYLLVPLFILALGAGVAIEALVRRLPEFLPRTPVRTTVALSGLCLVAAFAIGATNWVAADRSGDRSGERYLDTILDALPANAAILSYWSASTPLWYAQLVEGRRPDVLVIDDTEIVYAGWVTRERAINAHICERPVFILRLDDRDYIPTRQEFELVPFIDVDVSYGGPSAGAHRTVYRIEPHDPGMCAAG